MSKQVVLRSFSRPDERRERVCALWQGVGSVLLHALVFLLLPGLAAQAQAPREVRFELLSAVTPMELPAGDELSESAGVPESTGTEPTKNPEITEPGAGEYAASAPAAVEPEPTAAIQPEPEPVAEDTAAEQLPAAEEIPVAPVNQLDSTEVDMTPPPVEESPVVIDPPPALPEPVSEVKPEPKPEPVAEVKQDPISEPKPEPVPEPVAEVKQDPAPAPQPEPAPAQPAVDEVADTAGQGNGEPKSEGDGAGTAEQPGDGESDAGEAEGPPPPPPGPSPAELELLKVYGDGALKRIKGQARQPEAGGKGTVKFAFIIDRNGHLVDVFIVKTSGRKLLDDDVLDATRAAFNDAWEIKPFPQGISCEGHKFERSLTYPLY